jgi:hypothetical protein
MSSNLLLNLNDLKEIEKFKKKNNLEKKEPLEIIYTLVTYGRKINNVGDAKLLENIYDHILYEREDNLLNDIGKIKKLNYDKYKNNRIQRTRDFLDKLKDYEIYNLKCLSSNDEDILHLLIVIDKNTGVFRLYVGDINMDSYCGFITIINNPYNSKYKTTNFININYNYAYIDFILPHRNCNVKLSGTKLLNIFINMCKLFNIKRVDLWDDSKISCLVSNSINLKNKNQKKKKTLNKLVENDLKILKIISKGSSWYESHGFKPSADRKQRKVGNYTRKLFNIYLPSSVSNKLDFSKKKHYENYYAKYKLMIETIQNFD